MTVVHNAVTSSRVAIDDVSMVFQTSHGVFEAVRDISLTVEPGSFVAIVGPSGCGKSTILNAVAGLIAPAHGSVTVGDGGEQHGGDIGYLFQKDALLPWKSVLNNVALPLRYRGIAKAAAHDRAMSWLRRVRLERFADYYPHQLSGGMRKRVALATVFVYSPSVLLMDEPFSALDVQTRNLMENELLDLWQEERQTVLFVTHDLEEAIGLADRVVVLTAGPGRVKADYAVDLPRPRSLTEIRFTDDFQQLYRAIWQDLKSEVLEAYKADDTK